MDGTVQKWVNAYYLSHGFIFGNDNQVYRCNDWEIYNDALGRRYLEESEPVFFTPGKDKKGNLCALDVIRPWAETGLTEDGSPKPGFGLSCYREACEVIYNDGPGLRDRRFLLRLIGGHLHFKSKNHEHLAPGMVVEVGLKPNLNPKGPWQAIHIRNICSSREEFYALPLEYRRARPSLQSLRPH